MAVFWIFVLALYQAASAEYSFLEWNSCSSNPNSPLTIKNIAVTPVPVVLPGDISLSIDGTISRAVDSSNLVISLKRKTFIGEVSIPCLLHVGSCSYDSLCTIVDEMMTNNWAGVMGDIGRQIKQMLTANNVTYNACPQPAQSLSIRNYFIHLPKVPAVLSWFAAGDYHARITVTEHATGEEIMCIDGRLTVKESCHGFGCIFG